MAAPLSSSASLLIVFLAAIATFAPLTGWHVIVGGAAVLEGIWALLSVVAGIIQS